MSRQTIRQSFNRAAASYDAAATLQRRVCELLLAELSDAAPSAILDAGCGTGYGLGLLTDRWPQARLVAADFAAAMLAAAGGGVCSDIEALPFPAASFDLYWSSLTWQWCDVSRAVSEAARVLAPGGTLAVSSLGPGTLAELAAAFAGADRHRHVLEFVPARTLTAACAGAGLLEPRVEQRSVRLRYRDLAALLRELKALGANQIGGPRRPGLMGRQTWRAVETRYEAHRDAAGLPATFEVILCTARKPIS
jgi:malonyl-CoA O-methyltransferase